LIKTLNTNLRSSQLIDRVKEDEKGSLLGGQAQQLLEEGCYRHSVIRDVLKDRFIFKNENKKMRRGRCSVAKPSSSLRKAVTGTVSSGMS
jgi:hypothetical protein